MFTRCGSSVSAVIEKSRQPAALRAIDTALTPSTTNASRSSTSVIRYPATISMRVGLAGLPEVIAPCRIVIPRWRASVLTIALTALTGIVSVAGLISPAVLGVLERTAGRTARRGVALDHLAAGPGRRRPRDGVEPDLPRPPSCPRRPPLFAVGGLGSALDRAVARIRPALRTVGTVAASGAVARVLIAVANIHGPALAVGTPPGAVVARSYR